jgi:hypothetical protein
MIAWPCPFFALPMEPSVNQKNGMCSFSSATVVNGPWPGQINVSGASGKSSADFFRRTPRLAHGPNSEGSFILTLRIGIAISQQARTITARPAGHNPRIKLTGLVNKFQRSVSGGNDNDADGIICAKNWHRAAIPTSPPSFVPVAGRHHVAQDSRLRRHEPSHCIE